MRNLMDAIFVTRFLIAVSILLLCCGHTNSQFLSNGSPCKFPLEYEGEEVWDCVPFGGGGNWCRGFDDVWGPCLSHPLAAPPADRKVVSPRVEREKEIGAITKCCKKLADIKFESNLPVVIVDTSGEEIPDEPKTEASMCTCGSEGDDFNGAVGIEIRGSTSARDFAKKSYAVETRKNGTGESDNVELLGLPKENDWVFYGPEADSTLGFRNLLAYTLGRSMGRYASRLKYFELFLVDDGEPISMDHYAGLYMLAEQVKRGKNRVDISKREDEDLSGGYIFKYDNDNNDPGDTLFTTKLSTLQMILVYPKAGEKEEVQAIKGYLDDFEKALTSKKFKAKKGGYKEHIDVGSFIDYFLVSEITKNPDSYRGSAFIHKDAGSPITMGPLWDYNEAFGVCCGFPIEGFLKNGHSTGRSGGSAISPEGWRFNICIDQGRCKVDPLDGTSLWYRRMWQDPAFRRAAQKRWTELRAVTFSDDIIKEYLAETKLRLKGGALRNYARWTKALKGKKTNAANWRVWSARITTLETWLYKRLKWLDEQLIKEPLVIEKPPATDTTSNIG